MTRKEYDDVRFWVGVVLVAGFILSAAWGYAYPHDRAHPELDGWFMRLQSKGKVSCCEGSEVTRIEDADWDSKDGHYRVRLEGEWVDVPDEAVIEEPNKAGQTLVWPWRVNGKLDHVRCFLPGSMT